MFCIVHLKRPEKKYLVANIIKKIPNAKIHQIKAKWNIKISQYLK